MAECLADSLPDQPVLTKNAVGDRLHQAYDCWWDAIYPEMIAVGGDAALTEAAVERTRSKRKGS